MAQIKLKTSCKNIGNNKVKYITIGTPPTMTTSDL